MHVSKVFPTAIVLALALQAMAVVWWGATTDARVRNLEVRVQEGLQVWELAEVSFADRIRTVELVAERNGERMLSITASLSRIERLLEAGLLPRSP